MRRKPAVGAFARWIRSVSMAQIASLRETKDVGMGLCLTLCLGVGILFPSFSWHTVSDSAHARARPDIANGGERLAEVSAYSYCRQCVPPGVDCEGWGIIYA